MEARDFFFSNLRSSTNATADQLVWVHPRFVRMMDRRKVLLYVGGITDVLGVHMYASRSINSTSYSVPLTRVGKELLESNINCLSKALLTNNGTAEM